MYSIQLSFNNFEDKHNLNYIVYTINKYILKKINFKIICNVLIITINYDQIKCLETQSTNQT